jgi:hypothetical protein
MLIGLDRSRVSRDLRSAQNDTRLAFKSLRAARSFASEVNGQVRKSVNEATWFVFFAKLEWAALGPSK